MTCLWWNREIYINANFRRCAAKEIQSDKISLSCSDSNSNAPNILLCPLLLGHTYKWWRSYVLGQILSVLCIIDSLHRHLAQNSRFFLAIYCTGHGSWWLLQPGVSYCFSLSVVLSIFTTPGTSSCWDGFTRTYQLLSKIPKGAVIAQFFFLLLQLCHNALIFWSLCGEITSTAKKFNFWNPGQNWVEPASFLNFSETFFLLLCLF